jgi:hypothetical protein
MAASEVAQELLATPQQPAQRWQPATILYLFWQALSAEAAAAKPVFQRRRPRWHRDGDGPKLP